MSLSGIADQFHAIGTQFPGTVVVAGLLTFALLAGKKRNLLDEGKWIAALIVLLILWAFFPHGYHSLFSEEMPGLLIDQASNIPSQTALFYSDVFWTLIGAVVGWIASNFFDPYR